MESHPNAIFDESNQDEHTQIRSGHSRRASNRDPSLARLANTLDADVAQIETVQDSILAAATSVVPQPPDHGDPVFSRSPRAARSFSNSRRAAAQRQQSNQSLGEQAQQQREERAQSAAPQPAAEANRSEVAISEKQTISISDFASSEQLDGEAITLSMPALPSASQSSKGSQNNDSDVALAPRITLSHPALGTSSAEEDSEIGSGAKARELLLELKGQLQPREQQQAADSPTDDVSLAILAVAANPAASPGASPTDNISLAVLAAGTSPDVIQQLKQEAAQEDARSNLQNEDSDDDDVPLSVYSRGDGSSLHSRYAHSHRSHPNHIHGSHRSYSESEHSFHSFRHSPAHSFHHSQGLQYQSSHAGASQSTVSPASAASGSQRERQGSNATSATSAGLSFLSPTNQLPPLDAQTQSLAATVAHLILLRFEPWMAETSRTLRIMDQSIYNLEVRQMRQDDASSVAESSIDAREQRPVRCDHCGHENGIGRPGTLLHPSARRPDDRILDGRAGHPLLSIERDLQEDYMKIASSLAHQQQLRAQAERLAAEQAAAQAAVGTPTHTHAPKPLLNLPGLTGEGAIPGAGQARIETVPKRLTCVRCEGIGFIHNPKSKKKHNQAKNIQCKKCLTCKLCTGTGILMNVLPCKDCDANGFHHPGSETCRLGVGCDEGCVDCETCRGTGLLEDSDIQAKHSPIGWAPTHGLLANHPELRSPVGDRPPSLRKGAGSRSQNEMDKRSLASGNAASSIISGSDSSLENGRNQASTGSNPEVSSIAESNLGNEASKDAPAHSASFADAAQAPALQAANLRTISRSASNRSFNADSASLNTLGTLTVDSANDSGQARTSSASRGAPGTISRSESSRSVGQQQDGSGANDLSPNRADGSSPKRRSRALTTSSVKSPLELIKSNLSRSSSQKSFDAEASAHTIQTETQTKHSNPLSALKQAFSRSASQRSIQTYEASNDAGAYTASTGEEPVKQVNLRAGAEGSHRTLSRSASSKSFRAVGAEENATGAATVDVV
ncbi:hypothetical protein HDU96_002325 [Phlyctochytrium bullatum]|nr:hypothetical protein HDU96_002325 [Phlyctochytrium bullatum]